MSKTRDTGFLGNVIKVDASGNVSFVSGSTTLATLNTSGQLSGSSPVLSSSYALNADLLDGLDSTQFTLTSSFAAQTASFTAFTASVNSFTASQLVLNGTYATTGSNTFAGIQTVNSNLVVTGSITAQTLVVQTITSSVDFVTGSTRFGSILDNTHLFTGSVNITGSLTVVTTGTEFQVNATGVKMGNVLTDTHTVTGSVNVSGSAAFSGSVTTTKLIASSSVNFDPELASFTNASTGSAAEAAIYIKNGATTNDATFIETTGTNFTTTGGFIQDGGVIGTGTDLSGGLSLMVRANANMRFYTNGHTNERMRITNAGNVVIGNTTAYGGLTVSDFTANDGNDSLSFFYRGTSGAHQSLIKFYDFRGQVNASMGNELEDDTSGTPRARMVFKTSNGSSPVERIRISAAGIITAPSQVSFKGYITTNIEVSKSTWVTIPYNGEEYDTQSNFSTSTYKFTAPVAGKYLFAVNFNAYSLDDTAKLNVALVINSTSYYYIFIMPNLPTGNTGDVLISGAQILNLSASDTVDVRVYTDGSGLYGLSQTTSYNSFSGHLLG